MKDTPLVSVVIPCFNSEKWISETLSSVYNQLYSNIEVIIIDDGSLDNTKEIVLNYNSDIAYYHQENKGPSAARNLGVNKAKGEYIAFLDSDDLWNEDKLSKQISVLEKNKDIHLVYSNVTIINEDGALLYNHYNNVPSEKNNIIEKFFLGEIMMNTPTIVARRESILNVGGFDTALPLREDHYFLMLMADHFKTYHFKVPLVKRRVTQESMSNSVAPDKILELNEPFISKSLDTFPWLIKNYTDVYSRMSAIAGKAYWKNRDYQNGMKYMIKAINYQPSEWRNYIFMFLMLFRFKHEQIENTKRKVRMKFKK